MPLQNRVSPGGEIFATTARGSFLGNRGILHAADKRIIRQSRSSMWLICQLEFNGRKQELMHPKRYTQLFFLDEAVALAAGHRPCGECRRKNYHAYIEAANAQSEDPILGASNLDKALNDSRRAPRTPSAIASLPDGVFISLGDNDFRLVWSGALHRWSAEGYVDRVAITDVGFMEAAVVTPVLTVEALRHGYPVTVHPSIAPAMPERVSSTMVRVSQNHLATTSGGSSMNALTPDFRSEIEQILRTSSPGLTHGEVFRYLEQDLSVEEIVDRHGTSLSNVGGFMRSLDHLLEGTMPENKSAARTNSMVYKELLNHDLSPGLLNYVKHCLRLLMAINPEINMDPLRTRSHQYGSKQSRLTPQKAVCPNCSLQHAGECN